MVHIRFPDPCLISTDFQPDGTSWHRSLASSPCVFHSNGPPFTVQRKLRFTPSHSVSRQSDHPCTEGFECARAGEGRQTMLSPCLEDTCFCGTILTLTNYNDGLARWNMDSPRTRGLRRTLQRQQNLFLLDLEVIVGSQIEVVPTATYTEEALLTKESQGTVPAAVSNVRGRGLQRAAA